MSSQVTRTPAGHPDLLDFFAKTVTDGYLSPVIATVYCMEINRQLEAATIQKARADEEIERAKAQVKSDLVARYAAKLTTEKLRANILEQILTDANEHLRRIDRSGLLHDPLLLDQIALVLKGQSK